MANGNTIYDGLSKLNGQPVKAIVTGTNTTSKNTKTGDMAQMWIMSSVERPTDAAKSGADTSVCGECPHRPLLAKTTGKKPCYVNLGQAPNGIFKAKYAPALSSSHGTTPLLDKPVRLGAYGEPTALPFELVQEAVDNATGHTGYTHQWRDARFASFAKLCMASVDSESEASEAQHNGWRTFRVRSKEDALMPGEINCPASKESGYLTNCADCQLCSGTTRKAKNISIIEH